MRHPQHHQDQVKEEPGGGEDVQEQYQWTDGCRHHPENGLAQVEVRPDITPVSGEHLAFISQRSACLEPHIYSDG